jgi:hypothetical protein
MIRLSAVLLITALTGCASTQEIETSPPQPRTGAADGEAAAQEASFTVVMAGGETPLPSDVSHLRFRITEVRLRRSDGRWVRLPSDSAPIEISEGRQNVRRTLLDTRVAPVAYDSLTVAFDDVFVQFGANAGAPLTIPGDAPQQLAIGLNPARGAHTTVLLTVEAGASLTRSPDCRWFFVPILLSDLSVVSPAPAESRR